MGNNNRIAINTIFMYIRMFITLIVSLYSVRVVVKILGVSDYGIYSAIGGVVLVLSFVTSVISSASQRFFSVEIGKNNSTCLSILFNNIFFTYFLITIVFIFISESVGLYFVHSTLNIPEERKDVITWIYEFSVFAFIITFLSNPFQALIIAKEKMNIYAYISILEVVLKLLMVYALLLFDCDKLVLYSFLLFLSTLIVQLIYVYYCRRNYKECHFSYSWNPDLIKKILNYSGWTLFGSIAYICNSQGVNILLNLFFGTIANAAYTIGNQVKVHVNSFSTNFYVAVRPALIKSYAQGNQIYTKKLFYFSSKAIVSLLLFLMVPMIFEMKYILSLWLIDVEAYMVEFTQLMLVYAFILSISDPITTIVQASGKVKKYYLCVDGFSLMTLPLSWLALKAGASPFFPFFCSIIIFSIAHFIRLIVLREITDIKIIEYNKEIIIPLVLIIILNLIVFILFINRMEGNFCRLLTTLFVSFFVTSSVSWCVLLNREERRDIQKMIINKFNTK